MANRRELQIRLDFWNEALSKLRKAYISLLEGGVKSYMIDDRQLTRLDLPALANEIDDAEKKVDELTAALEGKKPLRSVGVIPSDW